jgi:hypothetical protein
MDRLAYSILKVLSYFDIFHYPLTQREINYFLDQPLPPEAMSPALNHLLHAGIIYKREGFYSLHNDTGYVQKRKKENYRAAALLPKARMVSNLLNGFPFVRAIGISGSLSKNVADPYADFDFFIITQVNRLWVARTLLILLRRCSILVGKQDWFCLNYFIDESCLLIPEQNIYTATEILTLIITRNNQTTHAFLEANNWVNAYYPNYLHKKTALKETGSANTIKKVIEFLLFPAFINHLDTWLMHLTVNRLVKRKKAGKMQPIRGKEMHLPLADKHYCKHDPAYFQADVLGAHADKLQAALEKYQQATAAVKPAFEGQ